VKKKLHEVTVLFKDGKRETLTVVSYTESHYTDEEGEHGSWSFNGLDGRRWVIPMDRVRRVTAREADSAASKPDGAGGSGVDHDADRKGAEGDRSDPADAPRKSRA
jgi:hypothetical protein